MKKYRKEIALTVIACLLLIVALFPSEAIKPDTAAQAVSPQEGVAQTESTQTVTLYEVPFDEALQVHIIQLCESKHIHPAIIFAMCFHESSYDATVVGDNGNSFGLMQIQPRWHYERMVRLECTNLLDPFQNVTVGIDYLAELRDLYDGHIARALTAYNQGYYDGTITEYALKVMETADTLRIK